MVAGMPSLSGLRFDIGVRERCGKDADTACNAARKYIYDTNINHGAMCDRVYK